MISFVNMQNRNFKSVWYVIVTLFAVFIFVVNEKIALMVVIGIWILVVILGVIRYILARFEKLKGDER